MQPISPLLGATCFLPYDMPLLKELGNFVRSIYKHTVPTGLRDSHAGTKANKGANDAASFTLIEFAQQLLLQVSPRSFLYRATLSGYLLLLRLTFAPCSRFHRLRHVPNPGPARADVSLFWFCVRIHEESTTNRHKLTRTGGACHSVRAVPLATVQYRTRQSHRPCINLCSFVFIRG